MNPAANPTGPYWQTWRGEFARALDPRLFTIEHLDQILLRGLAQAWFGENACLVTEIRPFPSGAMAICVLIAAGDKEEIAGPLRERAETWAKEGGCSFVIVESREGWGKVLKPFGYDQFQVSLIKEL